MWFAITYRDSNGKILKGPTALSWLGSALFLLGIAATFAGFEEKWGAGDFFYCFILLAGGVALFLLGRRSAARKK